MFIPVHMALLALLLVIVQKYCRKSLKFAAALFVLAPVLLTPYWLYKVHQDWFAWLKLYSVIAGAWWVIILCSTQWQEKRLARQLLLLILSVNILEAVVKDFSKSGWSHILDACSGLLLLLPLLTPLLRPRLRPNEIEIVSTGSVKELVWRGVDREWIVAYSLWNITFIYLNLPFLLSSHIIVLLVPLVCCFRHPERWLQARTYTLCITLLLQFTFGFYFKGPLINTEHWYNEQIALLASATTLAVIIVLFGWRYIFCRLTAINTSGQ